MAIVFTYTKSTNIVVVTGGTSGTPATFANFVTADRAGSVTLLAAWTPNNNTKALTYQITPVEKLALLISFVIASKTAEADYIFITGADAWDVAQTESINVTAGNGTYVSTKRFRTITNISCSDNAAGGGTVWADGTVAVTQPQWGVIWDICNSSVSSSVNRQYAVDCIFNIGDATTATVFQTKGESSVFTISIPQCQANAVLTIGEVSNSLYSKYPSYMKFYPTRDLQVGGTVNIYGSIIDFRSVGLNVGQSGTFNIMDSIISGNNPFNTTKQFVSESLTAAAISHSWRNVYITNVDSLLLRSTPVVFSDVWVEVAGTNSALANTQGATVNATGFLATNASIDVRTNTSGSITNLIDPKFHITNLTIVVANNIVREQYTCNVNICDKNGTAISGAVVYCVDNVGTAVWAAGTVTTDVNGNITQQIITYKSWTTTSETLTDYSPHKFTISKAGYRTLVLDNITVDHPIVWHLELQDGSSGGEGGRPIHPIGA